MPAVTKKQVEDALMLALPMNRLTWVETKKAAEIVWGFLFQGRPEDEKQ